MTQLLPQTGTCEIAGNSDTSADCSAEPRNLTYRRARALLGDHDRHVGCRVWIAAAAYLSFDVDDV